MRKTIATALLVLVAACSSAGEDLTLPPTGQGLLGVSLYFDRDGSGGPSPFDTAYVGALVELFVDGGVERVVLRPTEENGVATFFNVPYGRYRFEVDPESVGDSLPVIDGDGGLLEVRADPDSSVLGAVVRVSHATETIEGIRSASQGRRVFVHGIVTAGFQSFSDSSMFITLGGASLRITGASHWPGRNGNNVGDSVVVLGTTALDEGQPVLAGGRVLSLAEDFEPVIEEIGVGDIRSGGGGDLDAALVSVTDSEIVDTATVNEDFHVTVVSGADTALVVVDGNISIPTDAFAIGRDADWIGLLVPDGQGKLVPHASADLRRYSPELKATESCPRASAATCAALAPVDPAWEITRSPTVAARRAVRREIPRSPPIPSSEPQPNSQASVQNRQLVADSWSGVNGLISAQPCCGPIRN